MMIACLALLLSAEPVPPPLDTLPPPPLVPLDDTPERPRTPLVVPAVPQLEDPDVAETERVEAEAAESSADGFNIGRVAAVGGVAAGFGALLVGGALVLLVNNPRETYTPVVLLLSLPASLFIGSALAFAAHRGMGGRGGYGAHLGGGAIGGAVMNTAPCNVIGCI